MYKVSYVKCVCFLFLVILAVLSCSCSGFRIDNLAMTDVSRRNSHTSISSSTSNTLPSEEFFQRLIFSSQNDTEPHHKIRHHHRQSRSHDPLVPRRFEPQRQVQPTIETYILPPTPTTPLTPRKHPQRVPGRPQRSPKQPKKRHGTLEQAVAWKSYLSNTIIIARAESKNYLPQANCSVLFRVTEKIKQGAYMVDDRVRLEFPRSGQHCVVADVPARPNTYVNVNIKVSKEYFLFLNATGGHSYTIVGTPVLVKNPNKSRQIRKVVNNVIGPNFRLKKTKVELKVIPNNRTRLKLTCQVWGYPTPYITWKHNNNNTKKNIKYKKKKSTLVVKENGTYKCIARGLDETKSDEMRIPSRGEPCKPEMQKDYCEHTGICFYIKVMNEYGCECLDGFTGMRCQTKTSHFSTYGQTSTYTCKLGLSTKVFC